MFPVGVGSLKSLLIALLKCLGKGEQKTLAVFGLTPEACHGAVVYLHRGEPDLPIWLFSTVEPLPETAALCQRVHVRRNSLLLLLCAQWRLWPHWVAVGITTWTGESGNWAVKAAPFLIPPFRVVVMNDHSDFFPGTFNNVLLHFRRQLWNRAVSAWNICSGVSCATTLLAAANVLRWCGYPDRALFRMLIGGRPLRSFVPRLFW